MEQCSSKLNSIQMDKDLLLKKFMIYGTKEYMKDKDKDGFA